MANSSWWKYTFWKSVRPDRLRRLCTHSDTRTGTHLHLPFPSPYINIPSALLSSSTRGDFLEGSLLTLLLEGLPSEAGANIQTTKTDTGIKLSNVATLFLLKYRLFSCAHHLQFDFLRQRSYLYSCPVRRVRINST